MKNTNESKSELWTISEGEWSSKKHKWIKVPVLKIDGKNHKFKTPHGYINLLRKFGDQDENANKMIGYFQQIIDKHSILPELKMNFQTYTFFTLVPVFLMLVFVSLYKEVILYVYLDINEGKMLPLDFFKSNLFFLFLIIIVVYLLLTGVFKFFDPIFINSSGERKVSLDMSDQFSSIFVSIGVFLFKAVIIAIIPYYILYGFVNFGIIPFFAFLARINHYLPMVFMGLLYLFIVWIFIILRPINTRKKELIWGLKWIGFSILSFIIIIFIVG